MGELIGPEKLKELRAQREELIELGKYRHPSNRGAGIEGLIDDVRRLSEPEARKILMERTEAEMKFLGAMDSPEIPSVKDLGEDSHLEMDYEDRFEGGDYEG